MNKAKASKNIVTLGLAAAMIGLTGAPIIGQFLNTSTETTSTGTSSSIIASCDFTVRDFTGLLLNKGTSMQSAEPKLLTSNLESGSSGSRNLKLSPNLSSKQGSQTIAISGVAKIVKYSSLGDPECTRNSEVPLAAQQACLSGEYESNTASAILISKSGDGKGNDICEVTVQVKKSSASIQKAGSATQIGTMDPY